MEELAGCTEVTKCTTPEELRNLHIRASDGSHRILVASEG